MTLTESGVFEKAKLAKEKAEQAELDEQEKLQSYIDAINGKQLSENTLDTEAGTEVKLEEGWGTQTVKYVKTSNGAEVTELATVYAVSVGNQFVWIPCDAEDYTKYSWYKSTNTGEKTQIQKYGRFYV